MYLKYNKDNLKIVTGHQTLDTPFADSDDIRITQNTFEAISSEYKLNDFNYQLGYISRWQGHDSDHGYYFKSLADNSDGAIYGAVSYSKENTTAEVWGYSIDNFANIIYGTAEHVLNYSRNLELTGRIQLENESELGNSEIDAIMYGFALDAKMKETTISVAYNKADIGKTYFDGFGGGAAFTNASEATLSTLEKQDINAYKIGIEQENLFNKKLTTSYAFHMYDGKDDLIENDFIITYTVDNNIEIDGYLALINVAPENQSDVNS